MWFKLFRAEWRKIMGNRWATGCMIWIFPALAVLVSVIALIAAGVSSTVRAEFSADPAVWTEVAILPWLIPTNPLGQGLLLGFTAMMFAGENQWNTWKMVVPRSKRVPLILVKFFTVALFVVFAFTLMSILLTAGLGLVALASDANYGPALGGEVLSEFAGDYALQMLFAFVSTLIAAGIAALAAIFTRTILGSVMVGLIITIGQTFLIVPLAIIGNLLNADIFMHLFRFVPTWNLLNLLAWLNPESPGATPEGLEMPSGAVVVDSLLFSELVLVAWVVGLISLTAYVFQRQDIVN